MLCYHAVLCRVGCPFSNPFMDLSLFSLSIYLSVHLYIYLSISLSYLLSLSLLLTLYLFRSLSVSYSLTLFLSLYPSLSLSSFLSICFSLSHSPSLPPFSSLLSLRRFPIWTVGEYKTFDLLVTTLSAIGLPLVLFFIVTSLLQREKRKTQYLRIIYATTAIGLTVYVLGMSNNPSYYFCKDNAISYNLKYDGKYYILFCSANFRGPHIDPHPQAVP